MKLPQWVTAIILTRNLMCKMQRLFHHCHPQQKFGLSQILSGHFAYVKLHEPCKGSLLLTGYMQQKEQFLNYSGALANLEPLKRGAPCALF